MRPSFFLLFCRIFSISCYSLRHLFCDNIGLKELKIILLDLGGNMSTFKRAVKEIAKREGISRKEVYREMQRAINAGYYNPDPKIQAAWKEVPLRFGKPRPEDVVRYCANKLGA